MLMTQYMSVMFQWKDNLVFPFMTYVLYPKSFNLTGTLAIAIFESLFVLCQHLVYQFRLYVSVYMYLLVNTDYSQTTREALHQKMFQMQMHFATHRNISSFNIPTLHIAREWKSQQMIKVSSQLCACNSPDNWNR